VEPAAKSGAKSPVQSGMHADRHGYDPSHRHGGGHEDGFAKGPVSAGFSEMQIAILSLLKGRPSLIAYWQIAEAITITYDIQATEGAVRGALERLGVRGFLVRSRAAAGRAQGNRYAFSADPCPHIMPPDFTESDMEAPMEPDVPSCQKITPSFLTEKTDRKNLSVFSGEKDSGNVILQLESLTEDDVSFHWPNLAKARFGTCQIRQILARLLQVGIGAENLAQGLTYAEWELEHGIMRDKNGEPVTHPLNWVFSSLARTGYYRRPQDYISPQEQAEIDAAEENEHRKKARDARKNPRLRHGAPVFLRRKKRHRCAGESCFFHAGRHSPPSAFFPQGLAGYFEARPICGCGKAGQKHDNILGYVCKPSDPNH